MPPELTRLAEALQGLPEWLKRLEAAHASLLLLGAAWAMLHPIRPALAGWLPVASCALAALVYWEFWSLPLAVCLGLLAIVAARSREPCRARRCVALAGLCVLISSLAPLFVGGS